ncbi:hypothetical protein DXG01_007353 [Tephrocybe rancida]|nr:hypothetical protein DXG01_007353 [Tephrocybe rancida]
MPEPRGVARAPLAQHQPARPPPCQHLKPPMHAHGGTQPRSPLPLTTHRSRRHARTTPGPASTLNAAEQRRYPWSMHPHSSLPLTANRSRRHARTTPGPALTPNAAEQHGYPRSSVVHRRPPHSSLTDETPHPQQHVNHAEKRRCPHTATSAPEPQCNDHAPLLTACLRPPITPRMSPPPFPHLGGGGTRDDFL